MKFFGMRINTEKTWKTQKNMRKTWKNSRKIANSEIFLVDAVRCGRSPRGHDALWTPISERGRVALQMQIMCPPLMPEKYTGSRVLAISSWLTKMERYFRLMKYPTDIWIYVIATHVTDPTQACWTKHCNMCTWIGAIPGPAGQIFIRKWSRHSPPYLKWNMREGG